MFEKELKQGYQPKSCNLKNIVPPSVSTNVKPPKEGFDYVKNKMEKRIAKLEAEVIRLRNEILDIINKYTKFAETDRRTIAELKADNDARKFAMAMSEKVEKQLRAEVLEVRQHLNLTEREWGKDTTKLIHYKTQLTKAKEIIKDLSKSLFLAKGIVRDLIDDAVDFKESKERAIYCYEQEKFDTYKKAVQFLNSEVEKRQK